MKICKLKLKNLNSFREEVELDFERSPLDDASLVAITGPTGAGKTTLLDAICVALYGKTPRLTGQGSQNPKHLISHGEKEGSAEVHFMANDTRYLVTWAATQNGAPRVQLRYADSDKLITDKLQKGKSLGASQKTVSEEVASILGLDFNAFKRSVMLAQGEFAAFLKAKDEERRKILEATAGIGIYVILKDVLNKKVSEVETATANVLDKLNKIPEASHEQLAEAETEFDNLQREAKALEGQSQQIEKEKTRETKRKEDYEKLQASEKRQEALLDEQTEIDTRRAEKEDAERAERLRPEKQAFDTATLELENADKALCAATTQKTEAKNQTETNQADFDRKVEAYQTAFADRDQKVKLYNIAKSEVQQASTQFAEANKRTPQLVDIDNQMNALKDRLADQEIEQTQLQKQIDETQTFLDSNPLPLDRQQRLTRATGFLAQLNSQTDQLETASTSKVQQENKVSSLKRKIKKLSDTHTNLFSEKADTATTLEAASTQLNALLETRTQDEWNTRKQQATKAQPIAQKYEATIDNLADSENRLRELNHEKAALDTALDQIETELDRHTEVHQLAVEAVQHCENELKSLMWANPINEFRQHLHTGEPCLVCGATEHPFADAVEPEGEELLQNAENALVDAKTDADKAHARLQASEKKHIQTELNKRNTTEQIENCKTEITALRDNEKAQFLAEWQEIYPDIEVSSDWTAEQITEADTAIADIVEAEQAHTQASHACETAVQLLESCESSIESESQSLNEAKDQLQDVSNNVEDLKVVVADIETSLWDLLPKTFHCATPKEAKDLFENKIKEVEARENELNTADTQLQVLETNIAATQSNLEDLKDRCKTLQAEVDEYQREGETLLEIVRDRTDGLETEDEINAAVDALETEVKKKENARAEADQQLQKSRDILIENQTAHKGCEDRYKECGEKFEIAHDAYFVKLSEAGFDSPEAHDNAFRDEEQIQELTDHIDAHEGEKQQLEIEIATLRTRFEETPFDPEALGRIEVQVEEIGEQLQAAQQAVGAQQQRIDNLKDALEKREALGSDIAAAEAELTRWKRLREIIPANDLRDFALEIMFRQMGNLANEQLKYLTAERYQLKVEGIGDLAVIDRWNANEERPVETLSGGESFLTSLALALALADLSRGRAQLNSLFLDEGFGTLDTETLDVAIAALEGLRMQGRSIFLISHIQELTRRLPVKINVRKRGNGSSSVQV